MISKIVTTWWFSFLRLLIASTISSWMCLAHLSSYFLSSASSLKKKIMFVLDKSSSDSSEFITLLFGDLVCYYTLPCSLCSAASSASAARWSINIGPWFLSCQGGQGSWLSCGPHFTYPLHLYLNFLSLFNSTESFQSFLAFSNDGQASSCWFQYTVFRLVSIWCPHWFFSWSIFLSCPDCLVYGSVVAHW